MSSSTTQRAFDYQRFRSLAATDLVAYMEPIVTDPAVVVPPAALERIATEMDTYDEYRLVYSIELGMEHMPDLFAFEIVRFLSHECQSVRLAVYRNLSRLPPEMISDALIQTCDLAFKSGKQFPDVCDIVELLHNKQSTET